MKKLEQLSFKNTNNRRLIIKLYDKVRNKDYCVWNDQYPTLFEIDNDIKYNNLFALMKGNELLGCCSICYSKEMDNLDVWKVTNNSCEISRIVIDPLYHHQGLSVIMLENLIDEVKKRDYKSIHLSVEVNNIPAISLYKRLGFNFLCQHEMYNHTYYLCELVLGE